MAIPEPKDKLTRRQVDNLRAKWMRKAHLLGDRVLASVLGEEMEVECEGCGALVPCPTTGEALSNAQIGAAKIIFSKVFPDIAAEDFANATSEVADEGKTADNIAALFTDKDVVNKLVRHRYKDAVVARDYLIELTKNVESLHKEQRVS